MKRLICLLVLLLISTLAFAETIQLKSGKTIDAPVIEKTDKYIKVDIAGVGVTYFLDEIESIKGEDLYPDEEIKEENEQINVQLPMELYYTETEYGNQAEETPRGFKIPVDLTPAIPFLMVYGISLLVGLFLGLSFKGMMILIAGGIISFIALAFLGNQFLAMIISFICGGFCFYLFIKKET